jgi:hypothetical protein
MCCHLPVRRIRVMAADRRQYRPMRFFAASSAEGWLSDISR